MQAISVRAPVVARPARAAGPQRVARRSVVAFSAPKKEDIQAAIKEAEDTCAGGASGECAAAWDTVEELSAAASHAKEAVSSDPLEDLRNKNCDEDPSQPECRVYDD